MKKITLAKYRAMSPYKAGKLIMALNRNRVESRPTKKRTPLPKDLRQDLTKYIMRQWKN